MRCYTFALLCSGLAILILGCASPTATPTPTATPAPAPTVVTVEAETEEVSLTKIRERLDYALLPEYVPNGLKLSAANVSGSRGHLIFNGPTGRLNVSYPVPFSEEGFLVEGDPNSARRPDDAVTEVELGGEIGYLVRGKWSDATVAMGPFMEPGLAQWEYYGILSLYWSMRIQESNVGVVIQAQGSSLDWIEQEDMVEIAESLRQR